MALSLPSKQGIGRVDGDNVRPAVIANVGYFSGSGTPNGNVTPNAIGDVYTDTTNGSDWIAGGTTNTSWVLIASALLAGALPQTLITTVTLAQLQSGKIILAGAAGHTITPIYYKVVVTGTAGGSGNFILEDTNGTPVVITTITEAALNTAANSFISSEIATTGVTQGAGMNAALTAGKGIQIPAMASLTGLTSVTVILEYIVN